MKHLSLFTLFCILVCTSCTAQTNQQENTDEKHNSGNSEVLKETNIPKLEFLWETDTLLKTVESVLFDPGRKVIYTANINGHFMNKDGNGFISKVGVEGEIVEQKWITGLDAPTGLGIYQGKLYTTDIDQIVEIDIESETIVKKYEVDGAKAFNDVAIGPDGTVYCSDTGGNQIFALKNGQVKLIKAGVDTPNGLWVKGKSLYLTQWTPKSVGVLDLKALTVTKISDGINGPDGLEPFGQNSFLASGFFGLIYHIDALGEKQLLLDTTSEHINAADINYIEEKQLLLVPTMNSHKVMAYRLTEE